MEELRFQLEMRRLEMQREIEEKRMEAEERREMRRLEMQREEADKNRVFELERT